MGFEDKDREKLTQVHTDVQWIKSEHGKRLDNLETEDKMLHHRINAVRKLFIGFSAFLSALGGGVAVWVKSQLTGVN